MGILTLLCSLLMMMPMAHARETDEEPFSATHWTQGLHLFAGIGANTGLYLDSDRHGSLAGGANFATDFGYFFTDDWAFDLASNVKFDRVNGLLLWDTQFTLGVRYRVKGRLFGKQAPYARLFAGESPSVIYPNGRSIPGFSNEAGVSRIQYEGAVAGLAFGTSANASNGRVWFHEFGFTVQDLTQGTGIRPIQEVPNEVFHHSVGAVLIYNLYYNIGFMVF